MPEAPHPTAVTIFGRTYPLRGEDPRALEELAERVDARMRAIAQGTGTADTLKVAILAALNLADEHLQADRRLALREEAVESRLARLVGLLDDALAG